MAQQDLLTFRSQVGLDHPVSSTGIYEFRDSAHFIQYLRDLQDIYDIDYDQFRFEVSQDFQNPISRDPNAITVFQRMSNDSFIDPADRFIPTIADPVIQSIVNLNYEVLVGDALLTYMNDTQVFISDPLNNFSRSAIQTLRNGNVVGLNQVPKGVTLAQDDDIQSFLFGSCKCSIKIEKVDCNTVKVFGSCKDLLWGKGDGTVTINFATSGGQPTTVVRRVDGNFEFTFDISTFSSTVFFDVSADPDCVFGKTSFDFIGLNPDEALCDSEERKTEWDWKENQWHNQAISFQTRYNKNIFAGFEQAQIFSYYFNGTRWNNNNSKLRVNISATRKSLTCTFQNDEFETKSCNNCKDLQASVNSLYYYHCDGDVKGSFRRDGSGSWFITATQSVDFECCE